MDPIVIGLISGASTLLSDIIQKNAIEKQKRNAIEAYKKLLIPYSQSKIKADQYGDTVYTKAMNELNEGAFAYKGVLNPRVLQTIALSKMASARAQAEAETMRNDEAFNLNVMSKIAEIESQPSYQINPFNAIASGLEGYFAGKQLKLSESLMKSQTEYMDLLKSLLGNTASSMGKALLGSSSEDTLSITPNTNSSPDAIKPSDLISITPNENSSSNTNFSKDITALKSFNKNLSNTASIIKSLYNPASIQSNYAESLINNQNRYMETKPLSKLLDALLLAIKSKLSDDDSLIAKNMSNKSFFDEKLFFNRV